jgi:hypothetical protein
MSLDHPSLVPAHANILGDFVGKTEHAVTEIVLSLRVNLCQRT